MEIAFWKDAISLLPDLRKSPVEPEPVRSKIVDKCSRTLPHQVGQILTDTILTCLNFNMVTEKMNSYDTHMYFKTHVIKNLSDVVGKI